MFTFCGIGAGEYFVRQGNPRLRNGNDESLDSCQPASLGCLVTLRYYMCLGDEMQRGTMEICGEEIMF